MLVQGIYRSYGGRYSLNVGFHAHGKEVCEEVEKKEKNSAMVPGSTQGPGYMHFSPPTPCLQREHSWRTFFSMVCF